MTTDFEKIENYHTRDMPLCLLCGSPGKRSRRAEAILALEHASPHREVIQCKSCDFYWLWPQLTNDEKLKLYDATYFEDDVRGYSYQEQTTKCEECFEETASTFERLTFPQARILDIGCADGRFLQICQEKGLMAQGIEFSQSAAQSARNRGLNVQAGDIFHPELQLKHFDGIHMSHVLEHLDTPKSVAERLYSLLKPGGILYIEVPRQFDSWLAHANELRSPKPRFGPFSLHHSCFFSPKSISKLLNEAGFDIQSLKTSRSCRRAGQKGLGAAAVKSFVYLSSLFSRGDLVCVYARKPKE